MLGFGLTHYFNSNGVWEKTCRECRIEHCVYCGENGKFKGVFQCPLRCNRSHELTILTPRLPSPLPAYQCLSCADGYGAVYGEWICKEKWDRGAAQGAFNLDSLGLTSAGAMIY